MIGALEAPVALVLFPKGLRVSLPTHQIVFADDTSGHVPSGLWRDAARRI
jgi:hypothetical protein